jgi:hypothetical protein
MPKSAQITMWPAFSRGAPAYPFPDSDRQHETDAYQERAAFPSIAITLET